jgi:hypothetical protein
MIISKPRANCVLSIKTDKRYSVRQAAFSGSVCRAVRRFSLFLCILRRRLLSILRPDQLCWAVVTPQKPRIRPPSHQRLFGS